ADAIRAYLATNPPNPDPIRSMLFGLSNSEKVYLGRTATLRDPYILARREAADRALVEARPEVAPVMDSLAMIAAERREYGPAYRAFATLYNPSLGSALL